MFSFDRDIEKNSSYSCKLIETQNEMFNSLCMFCQVVEEFCCKVILRLLCRFAHSGAFLQLVLHTYSDVIPSKLSDYLQSWLPGGSPQPVDLNLLGEDSAEIKLGTFLFYEKEDADLQDIIKKLFISLALPTMDDDPKGGFLFLLIFI